MGGQKGGPRLRDFMLMPWRSSQKLSSVFFPIPVYIVGKDSGGRDSQSRGGRGGGGGDDSRGDRGRGGRDEGRGGGGGGGGGGSNRLGIQLLKETTG